MLDPEDHNSNVLRPKLKNFSGGLKFKPPLKYGWFHLNWYSKRFRPALN